MRSSGGRTRPWARAYAALAGLDFEEVGVAFEVRVFVVAFEVLVFEEEEEEEEKVVW